MSGVPCLMQAPTEECVDVTLTPHTRGMVETTWEHIRQAKGRELFKGEWF